MRAFVEKRTQCKEYLYFAMKFAQQKLSKWNAEVTPMTGMLHTSAEFLDTLERLRSFWKWDKGIDSNPVDESSHITQSQEAFLKYVENE